MKGLNERAAKFRTDSEKNLRYDIAYFFNNVDKKFGSPVKVSK
jgi:hypothetical protein